MSKKMDGEIRCALKAFLLYLRALDLRLSDATTGEQVWRDQEYTALINGFMVVKARAQIPLLPKQRAATVAGVENTKDMVYQAQKILDALGIPKEHQKDVLAAAAKGEA